MLQEKVFRYHFRCLMRGMEQQLLLCILLIWINGIWKRHFRVLSGKVIKKHSRGRDWQGQESRYVRIAGYSDRDVTFIISLKFHFQRCFCHRGSKNLSYSVIISISEFSARAVLVLLGFYSPHILMTITSALINQIPPG